MAFYYPPQSRCRASIVDAFLYLEVAITLWYRACTEENMKPLCAIGLRFHQTVVPKSNSYQPFAYMPQTQLWEAQGFSSCWHQNNWSSLLQPSQVCLEDRGVQSSLSVGGLRGELVDRGRWKVELANLWRMGFQALLIWKLFSLAYLLMLSHKKCSWQGHNSK